eukprot:snap_masked-scaffold_26-processed-gene-4.122-mRNA-1 protein AED:1.00 eAED:1.00 QI:0/0/0/0/1/1/2/0/59
MSASIAVCLTLKKPNTFKNHTVDERALERPTTSASILFFTIIVCFFDFQHTAPLLKKII